jgi:hypothetical protein
MTAETTEENPVYALARRQAHHREMGKCLTVAAPSRGYGRRFSPLLHVTTPKGSPIQPEFPAALGCRTHAS